MRTRFATSLVDFAKATALTLIAIVPWTLGLVVGLLVSLTLWIAVAATDGYRVGRGA
jgi:uncharacterized membrane protein YqjE